MTAREYLESTFTGERHNVRAAAECADGFKISIQGGTEYHYCDPRRTANIYYQVELGFPSELDDIIAPFAETPDTTETVFSYVPIEVVEELIVKHGGII